MGWMHETFSRGWGRTDRPRWIERRRGARTAIGFRHGSTGLHGATDSVEMPRPCLYRALSLRRSPRAMQQGAEASGVDALVDGLYLQLRALARSERRRSGAPATLHTTALVNELYLKLADVVRLRFGEARQFFSYAAQAMRHILLDRAKLQMRLKREDRRLRVALTDPD